MAETIELKATLRERAGRGAARAVRREGRVPAVVYGDEKPPQHVSLAYNEVWAQVKTGRFKSQLYALKIDGEIQRVIPRDIQFEPVRDFLIHVDFLRLGKGATVTVAVPVKFINEALSHGLKRGGVLNVVRHAIELVCPADAIPEEIAADLAGFEIGDSLHISAIKLPANVKPAIRDRDFTVATVAAPAVLAVEEEAAAAAPAEGAEAEAAAAEAAAGAEPAAGDKKAGGEKKAPPDRKAAAEKK